MKVILPSLLWIPFFSILFGIIKFCGYVENNWICTLFIMPISLYFLICIGWSILAILMIVLFKLIKK